MSVVEQAAPANEEIDDPVPSKDALHTAFIADAPKTWGRNIKTYDEAIRHAVTLSADQLKAYGNVRHLENKARLRAW